MRQCVQQLITAEFNGKIGYDYSTQLASLQSCHAKPNFRLMIYWLDGLIKRKQRVFSTV